MDAADWIGTRASVATSARTPCMYDGDVATGLGNKPCSIDPPRLSPQGDIAVAPKRNGVQARHQSRFNAHFVNSHSANIGWEARGYRQETSGSSTFFGGGSFPPTNRHF